MPTVSLSVYSGLGDDDTGDAHVISSGGTNLFDPIQTTGWVGREIKNGDEVNAFFAFDCSSIPRGSVIDGVNFDFTTNAVADGSGNIKLGWMIQDGVWEESGFANASTVSAPASPHYELAFKFPNDGTAVPHASQDSSLSVESGILFFNNFSTGNIAFSPGAFPASTRFSIGSGIGGEDFVEGGVVSYFNGAFNALGYDVNALTLDSQDVGNAANRVRLYLTEAGASLEPRLVLAYTENPPAFTSTPVTVADVSCAYSYDAEANAYSLGDQTAGFFDDVVFSLEGSPPTGMSIVSSTGVVSWTPTLSQEGASYPITVRATNEGSLFVDQPYTIAVPTTATPSITSAPVTVADVACAYSYDVEAINAVAGCQDATLVFSLPGVGGVNFPDGMTINSGTGVISWTPAFPTDEGAVFPVTVRATNVFDRFDEQSYSIAIPVAGTASITSSPIVVAQPEALYTYDVDANANVAACQDATLVFTMSVFPPGSDAGIVPTTGVVTWTATSADAGLLFDFTVRATNVFDRFDEQSWAVRVATSKDSVDASLNSGAAVDASPNSEAAVDASPNSGAAVDAGAVVRSAVDAGAVVRSAVDAALNYFPEE
jgi:hypothetical protein